MAQDSLGDASDGRLHERDGQRWHRPPDAATYRVWDSAAVPSVTAYSESSAVELGMKFRTSAAGTVTGVRFYKGAGNTGQHVGNLWSRSGQLLASVAFTNETASGWQEARFANPVAIAANTTYVISYHTNAGHFALNTNYFASSGRTVGPLRALANGEDGGNGVYRYGSTSAFPSSSYGSSNYWVDVVFQATTGTTPPPPAPTPTAGGLWDGSAAPAVASNSDTRAAELGMKFRTSTAGTVTGVQFYKGTANTGPHVGNLWSRAGQLLASVTFTNETASGWQEARFANPVAIAADTTYVISYHTNVGRYAINTNYFTSSGRSSGSLRALANNEDGGNGVYRYGSTSAFPNSTYSGSNYWVDVVFQPAQATAQAAAAAATEGAPQVQSAPAAQSFMAASSAVAAESAAAAVPNGTAARALQPTEPAGDATSGPIAPEAAGVTPDAPTLAAPTNEESVALEPVFRTGAFHSADPLAVHAATRWQVLREDDNLCVLDVLSRFGLTRFTPPRLVLEGDTAYLWRAQVIDEAGRASEWSDFGDFATEAESNPAPDGESAPPATDIDRNGIRDDRQPDFKMLTVEGTHQRIGVAAVESDAAPMLEAVASERLGLPNPLQTTASPQMALGLIHTRISVAQPGDEATVRVYLPGPLPRGCEWYEADLAAGTMRPAEGAVFSADRRSVTFTVRDGGPGDADGTVNGLIVTASGPGVTSAHASGGSRGQ